MSERTEEQEQQRDYDMNEITDRVRDSLPRFLSGAMKDMIADAVWTVLSDNWEGRKQ